ncbi:MAG: hypothetical protein ACI9J3_004110 [Parvicellaceae bacterium]
MHDIYKSLILNFQVEAFFIFEILLKKRILRK